MEPTASKQRYRQVIEQNSYLKDLGGIENGLLPLDSASFPLGRSATQVDALAGHCAHAEKTFLEQGLIHGAGLSLNAQKAVVDICITHAISDVLLETVNAKWAAERALSSGDGLAEGHYDIQSRCEWNLIKLMEFGWIGFKRQTPSLASGVLAGVEGVAIFSLLMAVAGDHARALQRFAQENPECPWGSEAAELYFFRMDVQD